MNGHAWIDLGLLQAGYGSLGCKEISLWFEKSVGRVGPKVPSPPSLNSSHSRTRTFFYACVPPPSTLIGMLSCGRRCRFWPRTKTNVRLPSV